MSIATTSLKYGWKLLAILTVGTGSIFVANNVLNRITTKDRIEVILALVERCYATQTGTNADGTPIYAVAPPVEVRTWADTNGASVIVTNSIDWRDDRSMKTNLDSKLNLLIPFFVNTNTVYDGSTNISMLTVTGLFADLQIGDKTNQFTAIPAIGTNPATFGPWAWRNYVVAWQERYKVLNAMKMTKQAMTGVATNYSYRVGYSSGDYAALSTAWLAASWSGALGPFGTYGVGGFTDYDSISPNSMGRGRGQVILSLGSDISTQITVNSYGIYFSIGPTIDIFCSNDIYGAFGRVIATGSGLPPVPFTTEILGDSSVVVPDRPGHPAGYWVYGWQIDNFYAALNWQFSYCTNKFW